MKFTSIESTPEKVYIPKYAVKARLKLREGEGWFAWTGEFLDPVLAEKHVLQRFNEPRYTRKYEFGIFVKDSKKQARLFKIIEMDQ